MTFRTASRCPAATGRVTSRRWYAVVETSRLLMKDLFDPYRPERHYMRGPGPKWHEKHRHAHAATRHGTGELARAVI